VIEVVIYWTGVVTLMSVGFLLTGACLFFGTQVWVHLLTEELSRVYRHEQLRYFMSRIKKHGLSDTLDYAKENQCRPMVDEDK
jgi:hypothetical protein